MRLHNILKDEPPEFKERRDRQTFLLQRLETREAEYEQKLAEYEREQAKHAQDTQLIKRVLSTVLDYLSSYRKRALPSRKGVSHRGVGFTGETHLELQERILPRFQEISPMPIQFIDNYLETTVDDDDSNFLFRWQTPPTFSRAYISLFDVLLPDHVFRGIFIPGIDGIDARPDTFVIINTWKLSTTMAFALRTALRFSSMSIATTYTILPNDLTYDTYEYLQREDKVCFGAGQCQHWAYITAYVFIKMFAEHGYLSRLVPPPEVVPPEFYTQVWRQLEAINNIEAYNAVQREMALLGGKKYIRHQD